ncbi:hypothetical protein SKAU_G00138960 [Synaphobranchus kaupii]|uniref:BEN domain-containing protein n=1 Tax=Synaphobranchus kaupii TaxID=118154 RepID=A0A9Q1FRU9_SYNKA|nr:hypothetical protein SKAU_G00138960 [Synaphobranchus kaupii]
MALDLATLVFGKDTLSRSTLTGKGKNSEVKEQLDAETVGTIIDHNGERHIPWPEVSEIRNLLLCKCNNE